MSVLILIIAAVSGIVAFILHKISKMKWRVKYGKKEVENLINSEQISQNITNSVRQNMKIYMQDIYLIISKVTEIVTRQERLKNIDQIQQQMSIGEDYLNKKKSRMEALFLDKLDNTIREKYENGEAEEKTTNIISHPDYTIYTLIIDTASMHIKDEIRHIIKDDAFIHTKKDTEAFRSMIHQKAERLFQVDMKTFNQFYTHHRDLPRQTVYHIQKDIREEMIKQYEDMLYRMKEAEETIQDLVDSLQNQLDDFVRSYVTKGAEETLTANGEPQNK
jgi:hypothetical protein